MGAVVNHCEILVWQRFQMVWSEREASVVWPEFLISVVPTEKINSSNLNLIVKAK